MFHQFKRLACLAVVVLLSMKGTAQTAITQWNFNSNPADAATGTGSTVASTGAGTIATLGTVTATFSSGSANGGSSDPAPAADNSGWQTTNYAAPSTGDKTTGLQFNVATTGYTDIIVSFDLRHSNTSSRYELLQYTLDVTAATPIWVDAQTFDGNAGDTWFNRSFNLSAITGLNNNANAAFRIVSTFAPAGTNYAASGSTSTYAATGTWRFDMVTVKGTTAATADVTPPVAQVYKTVSATNSWIKFSEALDATSATTLTNYVFTPSLNVTAATLNATNDTVFLTHDAIVDGQAYTLAVAGVQDVALNTMTAANFNILFNGSMPNLVITEIIHSPNTIEMIEVYNAGTTTANLNGLKWTDGTTGNFPNMTLAPGANILFSTVPSTAASLMGGTYYLINNGLGASNDQLVIRNTLDQVIDTVNYFVGTNGWPAAASNVYGYSFELNNAANDNNAGANWAVAQNIISSANGTILATPGSYPPPAPNPAPQVLSYKQTTATTTYVVFNQAVVSASATNATHYTFAPALNVTNVTLSATNDTAFLTHDAMPDGVAHVLTVSGVLNSSNVANTTANLDLIWNGGMPNLVITEIMHSPNDVEMIEVYNAGTTAVNLGGLKWTDGTTGNFPVVSLAAGATAVFATSVVSASATLGVATVYTINNGLGSSNDILVIRNSLNQVVDSVDYYVGTNGWPTAPTGIYAYSFELTSATADNNIGNNWVVPVNTITPQPTQGVIRGTPGVYPAPVVVMPNATISFVGSKVNVSENTTTVNIIANLQGNGANPASIDIELLPIGTATAGVDFTLPSSMTFNWDANANNVNDTIAITINNDGIAEADEYFIVRFTNPVNITLPGSAANHFTAYLLDDDTQAPVATQQLKLNYLTSIGNGTPGPNSAEIVAHDALSQRLFIANSLGAKIDIVNFTNPSAPVIIASIPVTPYGNINSIAAHNGIVAAAIENAVPEQPGKVVFFDTAGTFISQVTVGAMPDMITFNHAGTKVFTANEGQPNTSYTVDPEGSVSIIDISGGVASVTQSNVATAGFTAYNSQAAALKAAGIRIFGPNATVAQDLEPEYITISADDQTAYVTCQEANAIAVVNIATATVTAIKPLGTKDHMIPTNSLDANDQGGVIQMANWPVKGVYMPDAIASYTVGGQTYLVTANEGDSREYSAYEEPIRVSSSAYVLDPVAFPYADALKANMGRINATKASGDTDGDGDFDEIHVFGGRSISIWNATTGALVWDGGNQMELITAKHPVYGGLFNASNANNTFKNRSDDKGPEPEGVVTATINGKVYAFVALERVGGCMVYDITNPAAPVFVDYKNSRNLATYAGDNGAEGIIYIAPSQSPNGKALVILANEVSSTLAIYELSNDCAAISNDVTASGPTTICTSTSIMLTAAEGHAYQWSTGATTRTITVNAAGNYSVQVNGLSGCTVASDTVAIAVKNVPNVSILNAPGNSPNICEGKTTLLIANPNTDFTGYAFQWKKSGVVIPGATSSSYAVGAEGAYTLTVTGGGTGCAKTSTAKAVSVKPNPTANFTVTGNTEFCAGGSVTFVADFVPFYTYAWFKDGVNKGAGASKTFKEAGTYMLIAKLNGCADTSSSQVVTVNALPVASVSALGGAVICAGDTAVLDAAPNAMGFTYSWLKGTATVPGATDATYYATTAATYKAIVTDTNGCTSKASAGIAVKLNQTPNAIITPAGSTAIAANGSVKLKANTGSGYMYQWYLDGVAISGATAKEYIATAGGDYTVAVTKGNCGNVSAILTVTQSAIREIAGTTSEETGMEEAAFEFVAYPNPVSSVLTISVRNIENVNAIVHVVDMSGKLVAEKQMTEPSLSIDMSNYSTGFYLIRYKDAEGRTGTMKVSKL